MRVDVKKEELLEEGTYEATITSLEEMETSFGDRLMWRLMTTENVEVVAWTSFSQSEKSNLVKYATAVLGDVSAGFDTDDLIGKPCRALVDITQDKEGADKNKVTGIKAPKKNQKANAKPDSQVAATPASSSEASEPRGEEDFDSIPF